MSNNMENNDERNDFIAANESSGVQNANLLSENPPEIRGWLIFFLITLGVSSVRSTFITLTTLNINDYSGSIWLVLADVFTVCSMLCVAIYTITAILSRKTNAIFWAYIYLIYIVLSNVISLALGLDTSHDEGQAISGIIGAIIWILYLSFSKQIGRHFPKSQRRVSKTDKLVLRALIFVPILLFVLGVVQNNSIKDQKMQEELELQHQLENTYGNVSLQNGAQPYSQWYGNNLYFDDYTPHSEIRVSAPSESDVVVIVRYNNQDGNVAGHTYIKAGRSSTIYLKNEYNYQTFFYFGNGWYSSKEMRHGIKGGFVKNESYAKDDSPIYMNNSVLSYSLTQQINGNFQTSKSNEEEMF